MIAHPALLPNLFILICAVKERHNLTACAVLIGGKETAANAAYNAIFHSPRNRIRIIRIRGNIAEACRFIHLFAKGAIEEGNALRSGAGQLKSLISPQKTLPSQTPPDRHAS